MKRSSFEVVNVVNGPALTWSTERANRKRRLCLMEVEDDFADALQLSTLGISCIVLLLLLFDQ